MAVPIARARGAAVHVLHVAERDVVAGMDAGDLETPEEAEALLEASIAELGEAGVPVGGEVLRAVGSHADVADAILRRAGRLGAGLIVIGPDSGRTRLHPTITGRIAAGAPSHVIVLNPRAGALGRPHPAAGSGDAAALWRAARA
jgi:nucleotide-binding universal stress UspA family protein